MQVPGTSLHLLTVLFSHPSPSQRSGTWITSTQKPKVESASVMREACAGESKEGRVVAAGQIRTIYQNSRFGHVVGCSMEIWMEEVRPSTRSEVAALEMADFKCGADSYLPGRGTTFLPYDSTPNLESPRPCANHSRPCQVSRSLIAVARVAGPALSCPSKFKVWLGPMGKVCAFRGSPKLKWHATAH